MASKIHSNARFEIPQKADVVIVGGGFTGISASITLARAGLKVVVLEGGRLGEGASCRNGGLLGPKFQQIGRKKDWSANTVVTVFTQQ